MTIKLLNNRYQVIQVLGGGGFGDTFLAEDIHMPSRRRCVIKQLKPIANDPKTYQMIQQRFEREAATLEYLGEGSDQIPKLYAYFSENGQFYLVQEWIQGQTLTSIVRAKGLLSETEVRKILSSLLSVLDYVHSKGIIHRDIKPDNIILRSNNGKPVLIDFGAVKETVRSIATASGNLTQSIVIGTPGYMSSEQAIGRPVYATDIYSLGITAIYLLTGKHPHDLETHPQTGEIVWHQYAPLVSSHLLMVLNQAIQVNAGDRYTTASKMLYALQGTTSPPTTAPTSTTQATIPLSGGAIGSSQNTQLHSSHPRNPVISPSTNRQKLAWVVGSLAVGSLIGAVAIANMTRQPASEVPVATSPSPPSEANSTPTASPTSVADSNRPLQPRRTRVFTPRTPIVPDPVIINSQPQSQPQPVETSIPSPTAVVTIPEQKQEPATSQQPSELPSETKDPQYPVPTPQQQQPENPTPIPTPIPTPTQNPQVSTSPQQENQKVESANTSSRSVPAFPVGTSEDAVQAALGKPTKRSRGLWRTRAYLYQFEPNRIDLGYLFDQRTGILRQTEVAFSQSVEQDTIQTTLQGMLEGNTSDEIRQGLQRVYERRSNKYSFNVGELEGVVERNNEDQIYIAIWDAELH